MDRTYNQGMISCILLTAGNSSRFGSPKALVKLSNLTIIEQIQNVLIGSNLDEIIVVLGAFAEDIKQYLLKHKKIKVVYNKDYNLGQTSSFKAGLTAVSKQSQGVMLLPVDFPLVQTATINLLISQFQSRNASVLIPTYQNKKGHPPVFSRTLRKDFMALKDSEGLNTVAHKHAQEVCLCPVPDEGIVLSFNTPEEWAEVARHIQ
jgi:molybdenum cofactor cytidylyltransferase